MLNFSLLLFNVTALAQCQLCHKNVSKTCMWPDAIRSGASTLKIAAQMVTWPRSLCLFISGGHALRTGPLQSLSPLVSSFEGELAAPPSHCSGPTLDPLGTPPCTSATSSVPSPFKDNPSLADFVPILTQGWAEIFIRRPSGMWQHYNRFVWTKCVIDGVTRCQCFTLS